MPLIGCQAEWEAGHLCFGNLFELGNSLTYKTAKCFSDSIFIAAHVTKTKISHPATVKTH